MAFMIFTSAPFRSPMVMPSATTRPSIWWNMGEWVASASSLRNTRPGASIHRGGLWVSMKRICMGLVCVRSST